MQGARAFILPGVAALLLIVYYVWRMMSGDSTSSPAPADGGSKTGSPTAPAAPAGASTKATAPGSPRAATPAAATTGAGSDGGSTG